MKTYIVFLGLFVVGVFCVCVQGDMGAYAQEQLLLKEAAEECAAGAALLLDEEEYSKGRIVFDYEAGKKYAKDYLEYIKRNSKALTSGQVEIDMKFEDHEQGFSSTNMSRIPAVTVKLFVTTEDMFSVPFIEVTSLERSARYELPEEENDN